MWGVQAESIQRAMSLVSKQYLKSTVRVKSPIPRDSLWRIAGLAQEQLAWSFRQGWQREVLGKHAIAVGSS
jgi:hypothetical protein